MPLSYMLCVPPNPSSQQERQSQLHEGLNIMGIGLYFEMRHETHFRANDECWHFLHLTPHLTNACVQLLQCSLQLT